MKARPKLVFLGICAGAHEHFLDWCRTGVLPNLQRLVAKGLVGRTRNVPAVFVQCTWPSFYTGTGPARQGVHCWEQLKAGTYETYRAYTPDLVRTTPFWDYLSAAGKRVAILDIPQSRPSPHINGVQLVEWGAHDANHGFATSPASLAEEVLARFGQHPQNGLCDADRTPAQLAEFRDRLLRGIDGKLAVTRHFLAREDWDFFAQVFTEAHCIGHQAWHLHDRTHPRYNEADRALVGDPVRDVAVGIDRAIGEILADVDESTIVVVMAGHGMTAKYVPQFMLTDILLKLGVAKRASSAPPEPLPPSLRRTLDPILTWGWRHTPRAAHHLLEPLRHRARAMVETPTKIPLDPAAGKCFVVNNNSTHGGIRVNLVGREPEGKVLPGAEYEAFVEELSRDLLDLVNVDTGRRIVNRVIRRTDLYRGDATEHFPDLFVEWVGAEPVRAIRSARIGRIDREYSYCRTGEHVQAGVFIASGPGIPHGRLDREVSVLDFAPTFCEALGVDCDQFDGIAIPEIVEAMRGRLGPGVGGERTAPQRLPAQSTGH
ncbi:MAG: alkaline phosphatase family protein [Betaproteobacteria bacterium]